MNQLQQGDVNLTKIISIPHGVRKVKKSKLGYVLMHGESGNTHVIKDEIQLFEKDDILYMKNEFNVDLVHEEHKTLRIEPGIWEITPTHEYDYFEDSARNVRD